MDFSIFSTKVCEKYDSQYIEILFIYSLILFLILFILAKTVKSPNFCASWFPVSLKSDKFPVLTGMLLLLDKYPGRFGPGSFWPGRFGLGHFFLYFFLSILSRSIF